MRELKNRIDQGGLFHLHTDGTQNGLSEFIKFLKVIGFKGHLNFCYIDSSVDNRLDMSVKEFIFCELIDDVSDKEIRDYLKVKSLYWPEEILFNHPDILEPVNTISKESYVLFSLIKSLLKSNDEIIYITNCQSTLEESYQKKLAPIIEKAISSARTIITSDTPPEHWQSYLNAKIIKNQKNKFILIDSSCKDAKSQTQTLDPDIKLVA